MSSASSVTTWLHRLREGDTEAARPLWQRYYARLVQLAHQHLARRLQRGADAEDVALAAFARFCAGAAAGRFPRLDDRNDLWQVLLMLTLRQARDTARQELAQRRGGGNVLRAGDLFDLPDADLDRLASPEPDPAWAAAVAEETALLFDALPNAELQQVAQAALEGYTSAEIAQQLGCSLRSVERRRALIRQFWLERGLA